MKANYQAWNIDIDQFDELKSETEKFRFLIKFAVLAPSSHNSQPWKFQITENGIVLLPDFTRALPYSDNNHRQLFISLGAALENLLVAADYYGFSSSYEFLYENNGTPAVQVALQKTRDRLAEKDHLIFSIPKRHTNRNAYTETRPPAEILQQLKSYVTADTQVLFIENKETKDAIAEVVVNALIAAMDDKLFRKELSAYVKSNITSSPLGMPASGFGIPTPVSLLAPTMIKYINMNKLSKKKDLELLREYTPVFGVIATKEDSPRSWTEAGKLYERIALLTEKNGFAIAPMAAVIQIGEFYKKLQQIADIPQRPQVFFRLGYSTSASLPTPRLALNKVKE